MQDIRAELEELLVTKFEVESEHVTDDNASLDDIGLDSLAQVELGEVLGAQYGVEIDDDEMAGLSTLVELVKLVEGKLSNGNDLAAS